MNESRQARPAILRCADTAALFVGLTICILITTGLDRTLLQIHFSLNWPAWINRVEAIANGWLYDTVLVAAIGACLLARGQLMRMTLIAIPAQFILVHTLKFAFCRVRPVNGGDPLQFSPFSTLHESYPSGHATILFTLTFVIAGRYPRLRIPCLAVTLVYCWMRIHTAAHFGSDILAGALLAFGIATTARRLVKSTSEIEKRQKPRAWQPVTIALLTVILSAALTLPWHRRPPQLSALEADAVVTSLYTNLLDRQPDAPGLLSYSTRLQNGVPVLALVREVIGSDEYRRTLGSLDSPQARLHDVYQRLLRRDPTPSEIKRDSPLLTSASRLDGRLELLIMRITLSNKYRDTHP